MTPPNGYSTDVNTNDETDAPDASATTPAAVHNTQARLIRDDYVCSTVNQERHFEAGPDRARPRDEASLPSATVEQD